MNLIKTKGIVLKTIKFKESSIIATIFTEQLGIQNYIVNGVRKKSKSNLSAFYQSLNILDLIVYSDPKKDLHRISEVKFNYRYQSMQTDMTKVSVSFYLAELLYKSLRESVDIESIYHYIETDLITYDQEKEIDLDFHVRFTSQLLTHLGYSHHSDIQEGDYSRLGKLQRYNDVYNQYEIFSGKLKSLEVLSSIFH